MVRITDNRWKRNKFRIPAIYDPLFFTGNGDMHHLVFAPETSKTSNI